MVYDVPEHLLLMLLSTDPQGIAAQGHGSGGEAIAVLH